MIKKANLKSGISLITLIITIVVVIILAATVILTLGNNNPIENAKKAMFLNNLEKINTELQLSIASKIAKGEISSKSEVNLNTSEEIKEYIKSIDENEVLAQSIKIENGNIKIKDSSSLSAEQLKILNDSAYVKIDDYSSENLSVKLDAILNTGLTHDSTATTWKNTAGDGQEFEMNGDIEIGEKYFKFDGIDDYVNLGVIKEVPYTYEVLVEIEELTGENSYILGNWELGGGGIYIAKGTDYFRGSFYIGDGYKVAFNESKKVTLNKISLITFTYDGNSLYLYRDGIKIGARENMGNNYKFSNYDTIIAIGCNPYKNTSQSDYFKGKIYAARIYKRAISEQEAMKNYIKDRVVYGF